MLPPVMRNNHRPPTPKGVCLSGNTKRCPECRKPGALDGMQAGRVMALCAACGLGYKRWAAAKIADGGTTMIDRKRETNDQISIKAQVKQLRKDLNMSWIDFADKMNIGGLQTLVSPSGRPTSAKLIDILHALERIKSECANASVANPELESATAAPADETDIEHAEISVDMVSHDADVLECAHDLIFDALGVDLDELRSMGASIDTLICARRLGLDAVLHVSGGEVAL